MYRYPNGLECDASPLRIGIFETVVPPIGFVLILGWPAVAGRLVLAQHWGGLASFNAIMWSWVIWMLLVAFGFAILHDVWCRPTDGGLFGRRERRPELLPPDGASGE